MSLSPFARWLLLPCVLLFSPWVAAETVLQNALVRVELEPATLALRVIPTGKLAVQASVGVGPYQVSNLREQPCRVDWQWDDGAWSLSVELNQSDLLFSIRARDPGELVFLKQPGSAMGDGLIWPLAEGHYVPRGDVLWQEFLLDLGELNSTQDLSLPLWGLDHGSFTLHWLLTNPYNNHLALSAEGAAIALSVGHEFTSLDTGAPLTFRLSLGDHDLLAGAKRYRKWLVDSGRYETLENKLRKNPEIRKLLGATHVYLWGNAVLDQGGIQDWSRFLTHLRSKRALARELRSLLSTDARTILDSGPAPPAAHEQVALLRSFNSALNHIARRSWQGSPEPDMGLLARRYGELRSEVADVFGDALTADPTAWGGALSIALAQQLKAAGLPRLWLGLGDGWEGGLWHPEAVMAGVEAGYLIAPYDSYGTALASGDNPAWTTAHLGQHAYRNCAIVLQSGELKSGFQQTGHYTDPRCIRPLLEKRINAIQSKVGFNSWFLDVAASAMLFDSFRSGHTLTQAQNAAENAAAARWINETRQMPVGSEDGNAVTAQGIVFAHGMQTPVIGWGDADLTKNPRSPYFLGNWYPPEQPSIFFGVAPIKEIYRTIHFAPQTRLPLYQAVFHSSVITSHHWLFDSLKLSNVRVENQLTQLLYNVPALFHLSSATLTQRLPIIQRQDAFFRPLHERLALELMTDFMWLTEDRKVQQTTFSDGTRLVANFDSEVRVVQGMRLRGESIAAISVDGTMTEFQVSGKF